MVSAALTFAIASAASFAAQPLSDFKSITVDLPFGESMFEGPGSDAINGNCLACHSAETVLTQPRLPRNVWQAEVDKMRDAYKAPLSDEDVKPIVDYLAGTKGAN